MSDELCSQPAFAFRLTEAGDLGSPQGDQQHNHLPGGTPSVSGKPELEPAPAVIIRKTQYLTQECASQTHA